MLLIPAMRLKFTRISDSLSSVVGSSDTREGIEKTEASTGMCTYNDGAASRLLCASCEGSQRGDTEAWGCKKRHRKVRASQSRPGEHPRTLCQPHGSLTTPAHNHHLTQFSGNCLSGEQDLKPPLTYSCIGELFRFASEQRARAETPI